MQKNSVLNTALANQLLLETTADKSLSKDYLLKGFKGYLAPAKINLFLHVVGRRADGYHLLQTVFCLVNLCDVIYLKVSNDPAISRVNHVQGVLEADDLCVRAAKLLQSHTNSQQGAQIVVEKHIPMGGGLGGGSSDAATVLMALNNLWQCGLNRETLQALGLQLGADVPFFIYGQNAWAEGVGEQFQAINLPEKYYVLITPDINVPTREIFASEQLTKNTNPKTMLNFSEALNCSAVYVNGEFTNTLENIVRKKYSAVDSCLNALAKIATPRMSGSGSTVFAEFDSEVAAKHALFVVSAELNQIGITLKNAVVVSSLKYHPLAV